MKKILITAIVGASILVAPLVQAQQTVTTPPVGFITLNIEGDGFTLLGLGLFNAVDHQGVVAGATSGNDQTVITDDNASFTADQYATGYFIEILSGENAGIMVDIAGNTETTVTLAQDISGLLPVDTSYAIRKHHTIGSVFGDTNAAGLGGAATGASADELLIFNPVSQTSTTYFYNSIFNRWVNAANIVGNANGEILYPDQGLIIKRKVADPVSFKLLGSVKVGATALSIENGFNIVPNVYPVDVTLIETGFYTGDPTTGLQAAPTGASADELQVFDAATQTSATYFYNSIFNRWVNAANIAGNANDTVIASGVAVIINRKGGVPFNWTIAQPWTE